MNQTLENLRKHLISIQEIGFETCNRELFEYATLGLKLCEGKKPLSREEISIIAFDSGFVLSTGYGQGPDQLAPISDLETLRSFADKILKAQEDLQCTD